MEDLTLIPREKDKGVRIDKWLAAEGVASRAQVQQGIKDGTVLVDGARTKANYKIAGAEEVNIHIYALQVADVEPENLPLDIVFEDHDVAVVNKPQGMVVHPAPGHMSGTLVNALLYHCRELSEVNGAMRPGIVHRIDRDTSGLLMIAKNDKAHESLARQLQDKTVERTYRGIVHGVIEEDRGKIDAPIGRDQHDRKKMNVTAKNSKTAVTYFKVLERFRNYTYVQCQLETGRTHQVRVHMKYIGHPLAGDPKYGPRQTLPLPGQALHAAKLGFEHPRTGERLRFEASLPAGLKQWLTALKK